MTTTSPLARRGDQRTSIAAAEAVRPRISRLQSLILNLIADAGEDGLIDDEIVTILVNNCPGTVVKRRKELVDKGLVIDSGNVAQTRWGRWAICWVVAE